MSPAVRRGLSLALCAVLLPMAGGVGAATLTRADYAAHSRQIEADYQLERTACDRLTGNDKDVCLARAKGHAKVARAELDYNNTGDMADQNRLKLARADADHELAVTRCRALSGTAKSNCLTQAKTRFEHP